MKIKEQYINTIEALYRIDSEYPDTSELAKQLFVEAIIDSGYNWRDLPEDVLKNYATRCVNRENCFK